MRSVIIALAGLSLASASPSHAQAPRITEAGDPSVKADTLYRLAVKPEDFPEESAIFLLDDGVVRLNADGTGERTYRYVTQILTADGVEGWGERTLSYDGSRERLRLNWVKVIDAATGRVISDKPVHDQESLAPVAQSSPVYTDQKIRRLSLGGVAPGTIVDMSYTVETTQAFLPGDFTDFWSVHTGRPTLRSRFVVDVPAGMEPRIVEQNLTFRRRERTAGGRRVYEWATANLPKIDDEPFAADSNGVYMTIRLGGRTTWADVGSWYAGLSKDRYALTPAIEAKLAEVVKDARTLDDSLRAVHRWVAQDFRYVSLSLGIGGYQPRTPAQVFETQYGDCKDKATLFIALARRMGANAHPVLLSSTGGVDTKLPSIGQFDHMIAAVERPGGGYTYLDLTADLIPYGSISPGYQGEFGLVVHEDGRAEEIAFPRDEPVANRSEIIIAGELLADGTFTGTMTRQARGALQYGLRDAFSSRISDKDRQELKRAMAQSVFEGARGDSVEIFDGKDLRAEPRAWVALSGGRAATKSGGTLILNLPISEFANRSLVDDLESREGPRRFPIDVGSVVGPVVMVSEFRVTLPEGMRARLPDNVRAQSIFGTYTAEYSQSGRELRIVRSIAGREGVEPPEKIGLLVEWLKEVAKDDARFVVVEPAS